MYEDQSRWTDAALKAHVVATLKRQHPDVAHKITVRVKYLPTKIKELPQNLLRTGDLQNIMQ